MFLRTFFFFFYISYYLQDTLYTTNTVISKVFFFFPNVCLCVFVHSAQDFSSALTCVHDGRYVKYRNFFFFYNALLENLNIWLIKKKPCVNKHDENTDNVLTFRWSDNDNLSDGTIHSDT